MEQARAVSFIFLANQTALDFVNTEIVVNGKRVSLVQNYADFKAWLITANVVDAKRLEAAEEAWSAAEKAAVVEHALALRSQLREAAGQIAAGTPVSEQMLDAVNTLLRHPVGYAQVEATASGYNRRLHFAPQRPADLLAPLGEAASDLLCGIEPARVKRCENPACILYYYDNSKNHTRRWCSMNVCGNRMKAAAHYRKKRTAEDRT